VTHVSFAGSGRGAPGPVFSQVTCAIAGQRRHRRGAAHDRSRPPPGRRRPRRRRTSAPTIRDGAREFGNLPVYANVRTLTD